MEVNRRDFFRLVGMGGAAAALAGCAPAPPRKIFSYLIPEEEIAPGEAAWYATVCRECPAGCGMLGKTLEGRAVKAEGNPDHPVNRGALCARGQSSLQGLYNPDRFQQPLKRGADGSFQPISWDEGEGILAEHIANLKGKGNRVAFLTPLLTGSLDRLIQEFLKAIGGRGFRYELVSYESLREANRLAFGTNAVPYYDLEQAGLILSFGADFLETWLSPVEYARQFAAMRRYRDGRMGRFVYVGPRLSLTGANSDEWIPIRPGSEHYLVLAMIRVILEEGLDRGLSGEEKLRLKELVDPFTPPFASEKAAISQDKVRVLARSFARLHPSLALADGRTSNGTDICLAVNLLNYAVGNIGRTVRFDRTAAVAKISEYRSIRSLLEAMEREAISVLLLAEVNPVFTYPEAERFLQAIKKVPLVVSLSSFPDETAALTHLILPDHTFLESWSDYEPWEGIHGLQQPVVRPLYNTKSLGDIVLSVARRLGLENEFPWENFFAYLREKWKEIYRESKPAEDFESFWTQALMRGGFFKPAPPKTVRLNPKVLQHPFEAAKFTGQSDGFTLVPYSSPLFYDGRMANRPWLQELPDPLAQIVWDSWMEINPQDAQRLGVNEGDLLRVRSPYGAIELAAHITGGVRRGIVAVPIGQGHTAFGRYAEGRGANPITLLTPEPEARSGALPWIATRVTLEGTGKRHPLVSVAGSDRPHGREIIQAIPLSALQKGQYPKERPKLLQIYPEHPHPEHRWGMVIDLNACIGCSACVAACSAENNIPVVGKEEVAKGREMSWIRVQHVNEGEEESPEHRFLPMLCQHCDNAPCEPVCPVYATYHNPEGLNVQVYNRCVGTRYCSNNCPYKVRRFNWSTAEWPEPLNLQLNPDVTVRTMGVMEKCTFCIQRIRGTELGAKKEGRVVRDGEITPACVQTCPTQAMVFGDLKDPDSRVSKLAQDPRRYRVLEHLNTQPAITYLKKINAGPVEG